MKRLLAQRWKEDGLRLVWQISVCLTALVLILAAGVQVRAASDRHDSTVDNALTLLQQGREIFRYDTFGDERLWGGTLRACTKRSQVPLMAV